MVAFADQATADYADSLIRFASEQKLHEERYWRVLLHYQPTLSRTESLIDDPQFFLAEDGKFNPASELRATIRAFFREEMEGEAHPICRFIGRYEWLKERLAIDPSKLSVSGCEEFDQVIRELRPKSATLVFPTYYMNSPASMFGHTLITIETHHKSQLLSHAVNYSAQANETNGLLFSIKGLTGFYKGYYSILPYYQKIQEYSDINQRDMWEYPLNLTESEVRRMVRHIWELRNIYADYYFFDENCSYNLLFLLEAARPSLDLTSKFPLWALPIDTVKAMKAEGLIDDVRYRPSKATKIRHKISLLSHENQEIVKNMTNGAWEPETLSSLEIGRAEKIQIADLAAEYLQYQYAKKKVPKAVYQKVLLRTLKARSRLGISDQERYHVPVPDRPDQVHDTNRFHVGVGMQKDRFFQEIGWRPVFCDLLDTDHRHDQGIQLAFADTRFRYYPDDEKLALASLDLIDILSISPRDRFFKPYSWKIRTGFFRKTLSDGEDALVYRINTGGGFALYDDHVGLCYLLMEPELNIGGVLEGGHSLGIGFSAGLLKRITPSWKWHGSARKIWFESGETHRSTEISLSQNIRLSRNTSINLDISWKKEFGASHGEARVVWHVFF